MRTSTTKEQVKAKAAELGMPEDAMFYALDILSQNRNMVNALDNTTEMDEYIYHAIIKAAIEGKRHQAEKDFESSDEILRQQAKKDLTTLSREELITDPHYRAVLPILARIVVNAPMLRLHAEEASRIVFTLADFKRKHRTTSLTQIIVTKCATELENFHLEDTRMAS
ncbi:MAG: hypothetical protein ABR503_10435 [Chitinophagaceae bacterium]